MAAAVCNALRRGCGLAHQQPLTRWGGLAAAAVGGSRAYHGDQNSREPRITRPRRDGRDVNRERAAARTNIAMAGTLASGHQGLVFKTVDDYNQFMQSQLNQSMETGFGHRSYIAMFQRQIQLFDRMEMDGIMPVKKTFHILIQSAKHAGNLQMAEFFFQQYRNTGCEPTAIIYAMLITACADAGETDRAFKYLKWMEDDGLHNESLNMRVCIGLLEACAKTGDLARATIVTDRMQQGGLQHNVETAACLLGTYRTAMAAYDDHDSRVALLAECDAIFQHSRGFTVSGDVPQAVYSVMLQAVVEAGEYERAVQMLDDVYLHAERGGPTGKCLEVVVRAHLERGELEEALDTVSIFQNRPSIQTFMLMMRHLLESERPDRFVKTVHLLTKFKSYQWILKHTEIEWLLPLCSTAAVAAAQGEAPAAETPLAAAHAVWKILVEQGSWVERHALVDYHRAVGLLEPENTQRRAGVAAVNKIVRNTFPNNNVRFNMHFSSSIQVARTDPKVRREGWKEKKQIGGERRMPAWPSTGRPQKTLAERLLRP